MKLCSVNCMWKKMTFWAWWKMWEFKTLGIWTCWPKNVSEQCSASKMSGESQSKERSLCKLKDFYDRIHQQTWAFFTNLERSTYQHSRDCKVTVMGDDKAWIWAVNGFFHWYFFYFRHPCFSQLEVTHFSCLSVQ